MNQKKIGAFIAECRKRKKLTQLELAEKLGVTDRSISNNADHRKICNFFNIFCREYGNKIPLISLFTSHKELALDKSAVFLKKICYISSILSLFIWTFSIFFSQFHH